MTERRYELGLDSGGRRAYPEKLVPEDRNLLAHLRRRAPGPVLPGPPSANGR